MKLHSCTLFVLLIFALNSQASDADCNNNSLKILLPSKPLHFNSSIQSGTYTGIPASKLFAPLLSIDRNWEYSPYLAESWQNSADGLTTTFNLRPNAVFHDGKPIRSNDVAFSILTVRDNHTFKSMLASVDTVETPDPLTVVVHLKYPSPQLLLVAASPMLPILPKHIYGDGTSIKSHPANLAVVGSGPFQLVSNNETGIVMKKFTNFFFEGRPLLDCLMFVYTADNTMKISFNTGTVDLQGFVSDIEVATELNLNPDYTVDYDGYAGVGPIRFLTFNLSKPPLNNVLVRRAIAHAIDRDFIKQNVFQNKVQIAQTAIHPENPYYEENVQSYTYDIEYANQLLDQAGYPRSADGIRFNISIDTGSDPAGGYYLETTKYIQRELSRKLGIGVEIIYNRNFSDYAKRLSNYHYDIAFVNYFNWGDPTIGVDRIFDSKNIHEGKMFANMTGYKNIVVDKWMAAAGREPDLENRKKLYSEVQKMIASDLPVYPVTTLAFSTIYPSNLKGMESSIWGIMFPFDQVYWDHVE